VKYQKYWYNGTVQATCMYIVFVLWVFTYDYEGIDEFKFKHILGYLCGLAGNKCYPRLESSWLICSLIGEWAVSLAFAASRF